MAQVFKEELKNIIKKYEDLETERKELVEQSIKLEERETKVVDLQGDLAGAIEALVKIDFPNYHSEPCFFDINKVKKLLEKS